MKEVKGKMENITNKNIEQKRKEQMERVGENARKVLEIINKRKTRKN